MGYNSFGCSPTLLVSTSYQMESSQTLSVESTPIRLFIFGFAEGTFRKEKNEYICIKQRSYPSCKRPMR